MVAPLLLLLSIRATWTFYSFGLYAYPVLENSITASVLRFCINVSAPDRLGCKKYSQDLDRLLCSLSENVTRLSFVRGDGARLTMPVSLCSLPGRDCVQLFYDRLYLLGPLCRVSRLVKEESLLLSQLSQCGGIILDIRNEFAYDTLHVGFWYAFLDSIADAHVSGSFTQRSECSQKNANVSLFRDRNNPRSQLVKQLTSDKCTLFSAHLAPVSFDRYTPTSRSSEVRL